MKYIIMPKATALGLGLIDAHTQRLQNDTHVLLCEEDLYPTGKRLEDAAKEKDVQILTLEEALEAKDKLELK